ncbi:hypothetical protein EW146_g1237 [Bondarzewia mesenterica]|uniref:Cerato-platanin n=1 Tax=Bondarzewia mesenterica TaxID=1095465 RepID=A0A4S4M6D9_9AGAM|nr:hypothetical protein EW146_g1237 [Bondarzewia mesenterica]
MKFTFALAFLALFVPSAFAVSVSIRYDEVYDNANESLTNVACSNGANGLITEGFTTLGSIPSFPLVGAAQAVAGWNSPNCGSCWQISASNGNSISATAVDHAGDGFVLSLQAMNDLTNGQAVELGVIQAEAVQVDASNCGL